MLTKLLKAKIHNAIVTQTDINYNGSITIDENLLIASGLLPNEAVLIADCDNGNRFETYIIPGKAGSGIIGINGAASHLTKVGDRIIIMGFGFVYPGEMDSHESIVVIVDEENKIKEIAKHPSVLPG